MGSWRSLVRAAPSTETAVLGCRSLPAPHYSAQGHLLHLWEWTEAVQPQPFADGFWLPRLALR